jgi:DNA invertase Pin-like site-specific DNA recombinase
MTMPRTATGKEAVRVFTQAEFADMIERVRQARPEYGACFAVSGVDLKRADLWAAYVRQSTEEQQKNNAVPQYLDMIAEHAAKKGLVIPLEYVFYDNDSGTHLERPGIQYIRDTLMAQRRIAGVLFPNIERLSRNPTHAEIFENYAEHYRVQYVYCNLPDNIQGEDAHAKMVRRLLGEAASAYAASARANNLRGRIGLILQGSAPPSAAPFGYSYIRQRDEGTGRWGLARHELDGAIPGAVPPEGVSVWGLKDEAVLQDFFFPSTPAYFAALIYFRLVREQKSLTAVARELNEAGVPSPRNGARGWSSGNVRFITQKPNYYGQGVYNRTAWAENPNAPFSGDVTAQKKKTVRQVKEASQWKTFPVPALVDRRTWDAAQEVVRFHADGRGSTVKHKDALLRGVIVCPRCLMRMHYRQRARHTKNGERLYTFYTCQLHDHAAAPGRAYDCDFTSIIRGEDADAHAKRQLSALLSQPDNLRDAAEEYLAQTEDSNAGATQYQIERWTRKLSELDTKLERLGRGWVNGTIDDALYHRLQDELKTEREAARDALDRFQAASENQARIRHTVEEVVAALRAHRDVDLEDVAVMRRLLLTFQFAYVPYGTRDGEGQLVMFFQPQEWALSQVDGDELRHIPSSSWTQLSQVVTHSDALPPMPVGTLIRTVPVTGEP